jgi:hypothetical protein
LPYGFSARETAVHARPRPHPEPKDVSEAVNRMGFVPVIWMIWGAAVLLLAVVSLYASRMARNEEDQLFLGDSFSHVQAEQADIQAKVRRFLPVKRAVMALAGVMTLVLVGYYILNIVNQFR